jgi:hypothetical protein
MSHQGRGSRTSTADNQRTVIASRSTRETKRDPPGARVVEKPAKYGVFLGHPPDFRRPKLEARGSVAAERIVDSTPVGAGRDTDAVRPFRDGVEKRIGADERAERGRPKRWMTGPSVRPSAPLGRPKRIPRRLSATAALARPTPPPDQVFFSVCGRGAPRKRSKPRRARTSAPSSAASSPGPAPAAPWRRPRPRGGRSGGRAGAA